MTTTTPESRGQLAYTAYGKAVNFTTHDGQPMPLWSELAPQTRAGWAAAAQLIWDLATQREGHHRMSLTEDPHDPRLTHGADEQPTDQAKAYLVLSDEERAKGFVRPLRRSYRHVVCGTVTTMAELIAATYAREPGFYGATYCVQCRRHLRVGADGEFVWEDDGTKVGT